MTIFAIGQQTIAAAPNLAYPGDWYGLPGLAGSSTAATGAIAATNLQIGTFAWVIAGATTTQFTATQGSNTQLVFIPRTNSNVYDNADWLQGWGFTIPAQYQCEGCANGSFYTNITTSFNGGSIINVGDAVFVNTLNLTLAVGVTSQPDYVQSSYVVTQTGIVNTFGLNMVVISNVGAI